MLLKIKSIPRKILSFVLCTMVILGTCVIPGILPAEADEYLNSKLYDFSAESGTQYGPVNLTDSSGVSRQISRAHFSINVNGELEIENSLKAASAGPGGFLFNDKEGLFELKPGTGYYLSLRVKVVSSQEKFVYNGVTYPVSSQNTELKLAYGMPAVYAANKITMDTEIGTVAKVGTETDVFTSSLSGGEASYSIGEWYTFECEFTTPEAFGENGNVLGLALKSFNGVKILVDDVSISMLGTITVDPGVGTISQTKFPHKIGDKIKIENPSYTFGYDFEGWFTDAACTKEFTDQYVTEENCNIKLYAGWSETHFSFEGYTPVDPKFGFNDHFYDIIEDETAPDGNSVLQYHYTEEYWSQIRSGSEEDGTAVYYSSRRTQLDNNISLKQVKSYTTYVITFKYKLEANSGDVYIAPATGSKNIWHTNVYKEYSDSKMVLTAKEPNVWHEGRLAFTTEDVEKISSYYRNVATIRFYALSHTTTVAYLDDIRIEEATGDTSVKLIANGGAFKDSSTVKTQEAVVGDDIITLETPVRNDYDFDGWYYDEKCTQPVTNDKVDGSVYRNTLYAGWNRNMSFEGYYYDLESENRNNYLSNNVSITNENPHKGNFAAKLVNESGNNQKVIALNPINNNARYLITFHYSLSNTSAPVNVKFATMNYNINNGAEVKVYSESYKITADDAGRGYVLGAVIIETDFAAENANRLAMLISSDTSANYTVYFDTVEVQLIGEDEGYVIFTDEFTGEHKALVGKRDGEIEIYEPLRVTDKFLGWYTDRNTTALYSGGYTYSNALTRVYAKWAEGRGFEDESINLSSMTVVEDTDNPNNKYLSVSGTSKLKIATAVVGKRYGVEFRYSLSCASGNTTVTVDGSSYVINTNKVGMGWENVTLAVTASSSTVYLEVEPTNATVLIDDIIVYEIDSSMAVINFNQKDGYGEDSVKIGVKGTKINFPEVPVNSGNVFYGWYKDSDLKTVFSSRVFADSITLYARWASNPVTKVSLDDLDTENLPFNEANSNTVYLEKTHKKEGAHSLAFDRQSQETYNTFVPLANANGFVKLESNTTYAVSFHYYYPAYSSGCTIKFGFFTASGADYSNKKSVSSSYTVAYSTGWRSGCTYITTGDIGENNVLYIEITGGSKKTTLYLDSFAFTRVDEGRNHTFLYDDKNRKHYEVAGNCGELINYPNLNNENYKVSAWCNDQALTDAYTEGVHKEEKITVLYARYELATITFDNYLFEGSNSKYTVGDDISLSNEEAFDTLRSLKYSYNYAIKYFETANNAACMGRVNDNSTYKISFQYKLTEAQGDVDVKFLTTHLNNRWAFITDYDKATYTVYSSEIGNDWAKATVYLTTKFASIGTSGLFFTFNPRVEGETVLYIDTVEVEHIGTENGVAAFIGKDGYAVMYEEGTVGNKVTAPAAAPASQFSAFEGWYGDEELSDEFDSLTLTSGISYVYSDWTEKAERFDNYTYASNSAENYSKTNSVEDGILTGTLSKTPFNGFRIGKVDNNTSYKVTFDYKAQSGMNVKLATADEVSFFENTSYYNDRGNSIEAVGDNKWHTVSVYFTSSFTYTVPKDEFVNAAENKNACFGDMLYMYFEGDDGAVISIDNISLTEVEVLYSNGVSVLTEEASKEAGSQALRFFFAYKTNNTYSVDIAGTKMGVIERGIIFKNARNTATGTVNGDKVQVNPINLESKDKEGHTYVSKSSKLNEYWSYDNKNESLIYSAYIKNFNLTDSRLMGARGYIKVKDELGNIYTFYSADKKTTVKEGVELNSEITDTKVHTFAGVTFDNFTIVNPKLMPYIYGQQIEFLIKYAKETHGVDLPRFTEKAQETAYEIVIGDTTRDASGLVTVENESEYVIAMRGTKLIIKGGSDLATMQGVKDFIAYLKLKDSLGCGADIKDGYTKTGTISTTGDDYALTFNDEFDGTLLNRSVWGAYNTEKYPQTQNSPSQLGGKITMYVPGDPGYTTASGRVVEEPAFVRDGNAVLTCARLNDTDFSFNRMSTFWNMIYQYGMLEFNIKLPEHPVHVSLWMNGAATGGSSFVKLFGRESRGCMSEYDLIETYGKYNYFAANVHHWWTSTGVNDNGHLSLGAAYGTGEQNQTYVPDADETYLYDNYHIFTFLWSNDNLEFAVDGKKFYEFKNDSEYYDRMPNYIIIGAGMGNRDYGSTYDVEKHKDYYETLLDYVRLYQIENMGSFTRYAEK